MEMQMDHCKNRPRQIIKRWLFISCALLSVFTAAVVADTPAAAQSPLLLQSKPNRCVALHQGQVCYQSVQLLWRAEQAGDYCIFQAQAQQPLHCWQSAAEGEYTYAFASETPVQLHLVNSRTNTRIAETTVEVAWVYKTSSRRKTHWRIF
jgi:hypothetical protein